MSPEESVLTLDMLPPANASLEELNAFALSFPGYSWAGGGPAELGEKLQSLHAVYGGNCIEQLLIDGKISIQEAITWFRADLFFEQRSFRWASCGPGGADWARFQKSAQEAVDMLRLWIESDPV